MLKSWPTTSTSDNEHEEFDWTEYDPYPGYRYITFISGASAQVGGVSLYLPDVCAQKGTVVRVQVPEEIWAGESRPLFAVLNGAYNDGSPHTGDVPWSYAIEWQFAEPVWDEEGTGDDITYTPRPPDESQGEELVPSTILTGRHRLKEDTSPLYVGDMTSSAGGLAYARAIIRGVNISGGEVVQGTGTTDITSAWVAVYAKAELKLVTLDGRQTGCFSVYTDWYSQDSGTPIITAADEMESLSMTLDPPLQSDAVDTISVELNGNDYELDETGTNTNIFQYTDPPVTLTLTIEEISELDEDVLDVARVLVSLTAEGIDNRTMILRETSLDSACFEAQRGRLAVGFSDGLSNSVVDLAGVTVIDPMRSGESRMLLTESNSSSRTFIDLNSYSGFRLTLVDAPSTFDPESADTIICCVSRSETSESDDWYVRLDETEDNSMLFMSAFQSGTQDHDQPHPSAAETAANRLIVKRFPAVYGTTTDYCAVTEAGVWNFAVVSQGLTHISGGLILCALGTQDQAILPPGTELGATPETGDISRPVLIMKEEKLYTVEKFTQTVKMREDGIDFYVTLLQNRAQIEQSSEWGLYDKLGCVLHEMGFLDKSLRNNVLWLFDGWEIKYLAMMGYAPHINHGATAPSFVADLYRANKKMKPSSKSVKLPIGILLVDSHGMNGDLSLPWLEARQEGSGWALWGVSQNIGPTATQGQFSAFTFRSLMKNQHPQLIFLRACSAGTKAKQWREAGNADIFVGWNDSFSFQHSIGFGNDVLRLSWFNMYLPEAQRLSVKDIVDEVNKRLRETYDLLEGADREKEDPYKICDHLWGFLLPDGTRDAPERGDYPEPIMVINTAEGKENAVLKTGVDYDLEPFRGYEKYLERNPTHSQWLRSLR